MTDLSAEFDELIYRAAGSKVLYGLISTFLDHIARYRKPHISSENDARVSLEGHKAMVEAMMRGDGENVERIAKSHILEGRNRVLKEADSKRRAKREIASDPDGGAH